MLSNDLKNKLKSIFLNVAPYFLIIYIFFLSGRVIWQNWQLKLQSESIKAEINRLYQANHDLENLILYYQSDSFKEVQAREKLGLKKPGETVVFIPIFNKQNFSSELLKDRQQIASNQKPEELANWRLWINYIFS